MMFVVFNVLTIHPRLCSVCERHFFKVRFVSFWTNHETFFRKCLHSLYLYLMFALLEVTFVKLSLNEYYVSQCALCVCYRMHLTSGHVTLPPKFLVYLYFTRHLRTDAFTMWWNNNHIIANCPQIIIYNLK